MKKINKVLIGTLLGTMLTFSAQAQDKNKFQERSELIRQYGVTQNVTMGWYIGLVDTFEMRELLNRYLPLSNYLSNRLGRLVVLETGKTDKGVADKGMKGSLNIVYTSALMGSQLVKAGWIPIVGRSEDIRSVIVTPADVSIKEIQDFKGKQIWASEGGTVSQQVKYELINAGIIKDAEDKNFVQKRMDQGQLLDVLKNKQAPAVVTREINAEKFIKSNPSFKIAYKSGPIPGHMVLVSPNFDKSKIEPLRNAFLDLNADNADHKSILTSLDGYNEKEKKPFKSVAADNLKLANELYNNLNLGQNKTN